MSNLFPKSTSLFTINRLAAFDASDKARRVREEVLNSLEAFTYRARDLVEDESFIAVSTPEQRSNLEELLRSTSDWIYEEGHDAAEEVLKGRLNDLKALVDPIQKRKDEARRRPDAVKSLQDALEQTKSMASVIEDQVKKAAEASSSAAEELSKSSASSTATAEESATTNADPLADLEEEDMLKSTSSEDPKPSKVPEIMLYTEEDLKEITEAYESIQQWLDTKLAEQAKLSDSEDPAILIKDLENKSRRLNNVLMEIVQKKMRMPTKSKAFKPKATKKSKKSAKDKKAEENGDVEREIKFEQDKPPLSVKLPEDATEEEIKEAIEKAKKKVHDEL